MNTYYLVPVAEYEALITDSAKAPTEFDQVTEKIMKKPFITEDERAAKLRDALNGYLNYTRNHKDKDEKTSESEIANIVERVLESKTKSASRPLTFAAEQSYKTPRSNSGTAFKDSLMTDSGSESEDNIEPIINPVKVVKPIEIKKKVTKSKQPNFADVNPRNIVSTGRKRNKPRSNKRSITGTGMKGGWISRN